MPRFIGAPRRAPVAMLAASVAFAPWPAAAEAADTTAPPGDIVVTATRDAPASAVASTATIDAATIATTINAVNVEDTVKYLPSLIVRKRHIGDTQAPLATRTSGLGLSARSLIYADGALLSALIGNNNGIASPRWNLVSPQEIARVDVLYGPFSAVYPGNSIGAVVTITTRLPDTLEATATAGVDLQQFSQYTPAVTLPSWHGGATVGDRFGRFAFFASANHVTSNSQPLLYVTAARPATTSPGGTTTPGLVGTPTGGGFDDVNRTAAPIKVLGASGIEHQRQDNLKLKLAFDAAPGLRLAYTGGLFLNATTATAQTYLTDAASGLPIYAGTLNLGGRTYAVAPSAFDGGVYRYDERHWSHALSATGTGTSIDWQVIGTLYDFAHDDQRSPTVALSPLAQPTDVQGAGTITRLDGTGWQTLDARVTGRFAAAGSHALTAGAHYDRFELASNRYTTADWINGPPGALDLASRGDTRTAAVWAEDAWSPVRSVTLTLGGRYEWWRAFGGVNLSTAPPLAVVQPALTAARFSPKAALAWAATPALTLRASFGAAYRFPTVGELYQIVTTPIPAVPNPNLRPEHARSEELAAEYHDAHGTARLALFNEDIDDALVSQSGALPNTTTVATFFQNVDRTRARGVEASVARTDVVRGVDVSGSVTYADATTRADAAFPAAVGHLLPGVPHWKATLVTTWRPDPALALTAAARYASRLYGSLDNSDIVGNTFQGFYKYLVVDLRAELRVTRNVTFGLGVDNVNDDRYFLFHPFPGRSFAADLTVHL